MNKQLIAPAAIGAVFCALHAPAAGAVKVAPLSYNVELSSGQSKKGFIDVTNTDPAKVKFVFSVQAFKQLNAAGDLQFYDDEKMKAGIKLDYDSYELEPGKTLRLVFIADSSKLPSGDSFAAIFAATAPRAGASATAARVGTILTIQNGALAEHKAQITTLSLPFLQVGDVIKGTYSIKNTSDANKSAGFKPKVELTVDPLHSYTVNESSLVFAGIERQNNFSIQTGRFGLYQVTAGFGESKKTAWVFFATPLGAILAIAAIGIAVFSTTVIVRYLRSPNRGVRKKTKRQIPNRN